MLKYMTGPSTALGDTVKTSMGTITTPANTRGIVGVWGYAVGGPGFTTLEGQTGILELESDDINVQPCQIPLDPSQITGTGVLSQAIHVWPMNIKKTGQMRITGYMTMDMAITLANTGRWGLVLDVAE